MALAILSTYNWAFRRQYIFVSTEKQEIIWK
jgi:hypothetical protein